MVVVLDDLVKHT